MENTPATPQNRKATTDSEARTAKPEAKEYKLSFGGGLYLLVKPNGLKYWRMKYRFNGVEKSPFALGVYPQISLKEARQQQAHAKELLAQGIDTNEHKKAEKRLAILQSDNTFEAIANEWLSKQTQKADVTVKSYKRYLAYAVEAIGYKPITDVTSPDVFALCRKIEAKGTIETAHRVKTTCRLVFRPRHLRTYPSFNRCITARY